MEQEHKAYADKVSAYVDALYGQDVDMTQYRTAAKVYEASRLGRHIMDGMIDGDADTVNRVCTIVTAAHKDAYGSGTAGDLRYGPDGYDDERARKDIKSGRAEQWAADYGRIYAKLDYVNFADYVDDHALIEGDDKAADTDEKFDTMLSNRVKRHRMWTYEDNDVLNKAIVAEHELTERLSVEEAKDAPDGHEGEYVGRDRDRRLGDLFSRVYDTSNAFSDASWQYVPRTTSAALEDAPQRGVTQGTFDELGDEYTSYESERISEYAQHMRNAYSSKQSHRSIAGADLNRKAVMDDYKAPELFIEKTKTKAKTADVKSVVPVDKKHVTEKVEADSVRRVKRNIPKAVKAVENVERRHKADTPRPVAHMFPQFESSESKSVDEPSL